MKRRITALAAIAVVLAVVGVATARGCSVIDQIVVSLFGPPAVQAKETHAAEGTATFDHAAFDRLLRAHVDEDGWIDYAAVKRDESKLDAYLAAVAAAPFDDLSRDGKLALLINAYNAMTLRLIVEHWNDGALQSIRDLDKPWDTKRWSVAGKTVSLNDLEHKLIRENFAEPRIHFALVCAAVGCPKLLNRAYTAERLESQLAGQTRYVHTHDRWFRLHSKDQAVSLTKLYQWYGGDFEQAAGSVVRYVAKQVPAVAAMLDSGTTPSIRWLDYDWALNDKRNRPKQN